MKRIPKLHYTQINHFLSNIDRSGSADDCWLWQGYFNWGGYGVFVINGKNYKAHRVSFFLANGRINDELQVMHKCDVRACVNPKHLSQGTAKDNSQDSVRKGRNTRLYGEQNGKAKLTKQKVKAIRRMLQAVADGRLKMYQYQIASHYGVSPATVSYLKNGGRWDNPR
jgi:anti-sigma28 factor (negative regulator of flagellin synthesis)